MASSHDGHGGAGRLLERYVDLHNQGVQGGDFTAILALFASDATFAFEGIDLGPFAGGEAIAAAFARQPPTEPLQAGPMEISDAHAWCRYAWASAPANPAGSLLLEAAGGQIIRLVVRADRVVSGGGLPHVILNGGSSAGKSSLAKALQWRLTAEYMHISWDHFVELCPPRCRTEGFDVPAEVTDRLITGFHASLGAYAAAGNLLIIEHVLHKPAWVAQVASALAGRPTLLVGVRCGVEELERRERQRGDRPIGLARRQIEQAEKLVNGDYDLIVTTTAQSPEQAAEHVSAYLMAGGACQAFARLAGRVPAI